MKRTQIAAANWKMNLDLAQAGRLIDEILAGDAVMGEGQITVFAVPFPYLLTVQGKLTGRAGLFVAAQNCASTKNGAFTGEVSAEMLKGMGVHYVIIGHSERREYYRETNAILAEKLNRAFESGIRPILCCGEPLSVREAGTQNSYVEKQLAESLFHLEASQLKGFVIAYEPIWAIGTGRASSGADAEEVCGGIRATLARLYSQKTAGEIRIQYGGSVKPGNMAEYAGQLDIDGALVGGASLKAADFAGIIRATREARK